MTHDQADANHCKKFSKSITLEKGNKHFCCSCSYSSNQPFRYGSNVETELEQLKYIFKKTESFELCQCKSSARVPFCDVTNAQQDGLYEVDPAPKAKSEMPVRQPTKEKPLKARIHVIARGGLSKIGHHGEMAAMGELGAKLPQMRCDTML